MSRSDKPFTLDEANRELPLIRSIALDISNDFGELSQLYKQFKALPKGQPSKLLEQLEIRSDELYLRIDGYIAELRDLGATVVSHDSDCVHFRIRNGKKDAVYCWQLGEAEVSHWHYASESEATRRLVARSVQPG